MGLVVVVAKYRTENKALWVHGGLREGTEAENVEIEVLMRGVWNQSESGWGKNSFCVQSQDHTEQSRRLFTTELNMTKKWLLWKPQPANFSINIANAFMLYSDEK